LGTVQGARESYIQGRQERQERIAAFLAQPDMNVQKVQSFFKDMFVGTADTALGPLGAGLADGVASTLGKAQDVISQICSDLNAGKKITARQIADALKVGGDVASTFIPGGAAVKGAKAAAGAAKAVKSGVQVSKANRAMRVGESLKSLPKPKTVGLKPRMTPGTATMSNPLVNHPTLLRGTHGNAGFIPTDIGAKLAGKEFKSFDEFRGAFWKTVADSKYAGEFKMAQLSKMKDGYAPPAPATQSLGKRGAYELHHQTPIQHGGGVYDLNNLIITTPRYHKEVLSKEFHFRKGNKE
jgi:hypothetical protein